jgi:hypothetical protein
LDEHADHCDMKDQLRRHVPPTRRRVVARRALVSARPGFGEGCSLLA